MASEVRHHFTDSQVLGQFGSYDLMLGHAKILPNKFSPPELLERLKVFANSLDHIPTAADIDQNLNMPGAVVYIRYFGSIEDAIKKAKIKPKLVKSPESSPAPDSYVTVSPNLRLVPAAAPHPQPAPPQSVRPHFDGTLVEFLGQHKFRNLNFKNPIDVMLLSGIWNLPLVAPHFAANWGALRRQCRAVGMEFVTHIIRLGIETGAIATLAPRFVTVEFYQNPEARINDYTVRVTFGESRPRPKVAEDDIEPDRVVFKLREGHAGVYEVTALTGVFSTGVVLAIVDGEGQRELAEIAANAEAPDTDAADNVTPISAVVAGGRVFAPEIDENLLRDLIPKPEGYTSIEPDLRPLTTPIIDVKVGALEYPATPPILPGLGGYSLLDPDVMKNFQTPPTVERPAVGPAVDLPEFVGSDTFLPEAPGIDVAGYAFLGGSFALGAAAVAFGPELLVVSGLEESPFLIPAFVW